MKVKFFSVNFVVFAQFVLFGCTTVTPHIVPGVESEIEKTMQQASQAWEEFPKTLNRASLLKHFASNYSGVDDGKSRTLKDIKKSLDDFSEQIKMGIVTGMSYQVSDLNIQPIASHLAWLIFQENTQLKRAGVHFAKITTKCSALVRKEKEGWVIFHSHCSTVNA